VYHVQPKRAYDVDILISDATKLFPPEMSKKFSHNIDFNIRQAGKCFAFELPTAAVFHLLRAAEEIIRDYYSIIVGSVPKIKLRNWGVYIKALRENGADEKIVRVLEQIKDIHRNPIMHPDNKLEMEESLSLLGIIESAMNAMLADIDKRKSLVVATNLRGTAAP
jgi:hypothetical protein